jgi:hypothetical protein
MKRIFIVLALLLAGVTAASADPPYDGLSFGLFYSSLEPYGEWISVDAGLYAWRPVGVSPDWRPYWNGQWLWSDDGWYWASEEPWAWATYHYGRWYFDDYYGWVWVPGYDWAPAWVEWRYGGDYVGWAPLGPYAVFSVNFGVFYSTNWVTPYTWWTFTDCRYMGSPAIYDHVYRTTENSRIIGRTRFGGSVGASGGRIITRGPEREYVERRGSGRVPRTDIVPVTQRQPERYLRDGDRSRVEVYRPTAEQFRSTEVEHPARVREGERRIGLDVENLDVRTRTIDQGEARDARRTTPSRQQREGEWNADVQRLPPRYQQAPERSTPEAWQRQQSQREGWRAPESQRLQRQERQMDRQPAQRLPTQRLDRQPAPRQERQVDRPQPRQQTWTQPSPPAPKPATPPRGESRKRD